MAGLWQLYDQQGRPIHGQAAASDDVLNQGLLHGEAHVWIWRRTAMGPEVLLQKRATSKPTWPDCFDISAAGHIDVGEEPLAAALRETKEEIGLDAKEPALHYIGTHYRRLAVPGTPKIEHEFSWLYLLELPSQTPFTFQDGEVAALFWKPPAQIQKELADPKAKERYVPHGDTYFQIIFDAIEQAASSSS